MSTNRKLIRVAILSLLILLVSVAPLAAQSAALASVGALGAANLYLTYLSLGVIADGLAGETYDQAATIQLVESVGRFSISSRESLKILRDREELSESDGDYVLRMIGTMDLLVREAEGLRQYVETGDEEWLEHFSENRVKAWEQIQAMMNPPE